MDSGRSTRALPRVGFPIRTSRDHGLVSTSPGLFAAAHVLRRLLAPRHPPCALSLLIYEEHRVCRYGVFKVRAGRSRRAESRPWAGLSKLNSVERRGRRCSRRAGELDGKAIDSAGASGVKSSGIPRKEVIQPQLPLRLPCYDFTPIMSHTLGRCLPCGSAHGLLVQPTFVM